MKLPLHWKGNSHPILGNTESPKQDKPKEKHQQKLNTNKNY